MKDNYSKSIKLRCITCGDDSSFDSNEDESYIKCNRCGKEYHGGKTELKELNQDLIEKEVGTMTEEVKLDLKEDIEKMFKNLFK